MNGRDRSKNFGLRAAIKSCIFAGIIAIQAISFSHRAGATWNVIHQFSFNNEGVVRASFFFNPRVGLIGFEWHGASSNGIIKRTTDGGLTWTNSIVPNLSVPTAAIVTDIWFVTPDTGWLTVSVGLTSGDPSLWRTNDSGKTWNPVSAYSGIYPVSVRLSDSALIVTDAQGIGIVWSTDSGKTWPGSKNTFKNGLGFEDGLNGVASAFRGVCLQTNNGGLTWNSAPAGYPFEGWDVYAVRHGKVFVAAPEDTAYNFVNRPSKVWRSIDNGRDFSSSVTLPFRTNGAVRGIYGVLYVQSDSSIKNASVDGLMRSTDSGRTWQSSDNGVPIGGPDEKDDSRFSVTGCGNVIYAFDNYGGVWKTIDGGDGFVPPQCKFVDNDTIAPLITTICDTDLGVNYLHNPNPGPVIINDISILDSARRPAKTVSIYFDSLPDHYISIQPGDSIAYRLAWHPGNMMDSTGSDSATIRVIFFVSYFPLYPESGLNPLDTIYLRVKLTGQSTLPSYTLSTTTIKTPTLVTCMSVDTTINFVNTSCDSILFKSTKLVKGTWSYSLGKDGTPVNAPFYLHVGDTLHIRLQATPTTSTIVMDSLRLNMHYMGADTNIGIGMRTNARVGQSLIVQQALDFDSVATCVSSTQTISIPNLGCDSAELTQASIADPHFELLDTNGVPLKLPIYVLGNSVLRVKVKFTPSTLGQKSGSINLKYTYYQTDSLKQIALNGFGSAFGKMDYPKVFDFQNVSICSYLDTTITITNNRCLKAFIDSLRVPEPFVSLDSAKLPLSIDTGASGSVQLRLRFRPGAKQTVSAPVYVKFALDNAASFEWDTLSFTGTGIPGQSDLAADSAKLDFGTLSTCGSGTSLTFKVFNPACDTSILTGLSLDPSLSGVFSAQSDKAMPAKLSVNDTAVITVAITSLIANTYAGNLQIQYTLSDGSTHDLAIPISLIVTNGGGTSTLNMTTPPPANPTINFNTIRACTNSTDSGIVLSNPSCVPVKISYTISGSGFVLVNGPKTDTIIPAGGKITIKVAYDGSTSGSLSSTVPITSDAQSNPNSYAVQLLGNVPPGGNVVFNLSFSKTTISPGDIFNVYLTPDKPISGAQLNEIRGILEYHADAFNPVPGAVSQSGTTLPGNGPASPSAAYPKGTVAHYPFDIKGTDISLAPGTNIVTIPLQAMVTDTNGGKIWVDSIVLNPSDPNYGACTLTSNRSILPLTTTISNQCGDSTLILVLQQKPLFASERLRPNPVTQESGYKSTLGLVSAEDGFAEISLYDALGQVVSRGNISLTHGQSTDYTFDMHELNSGSYYFSVLFNGQTSSGHLRGTMLLVK